MTLLTTQTLSALDNAFLQVEDRENRMQLAGVLLFRGDPPDYATFRKAVEERLLGLPRFRQRLRPAAFGLTRPAWVDDSAFDLDYHLSRLALPAPGGHDEIAAHIDHLTSAPLDMRRPLWEVGLVEGVRDGFAVSLKVHHCMVDGLSIVDIFAALLAPDSDLGAAAPARSSARPTAPDPSPLQRARGFTAMLGQAPSTVLNVGDSGPTRRTTYLTVPLDDIHAIRRAHGTTVNNIVLAVVTGALRRYLARKDALVDNLYAFVPVNRRPADARGRLGNQIAMTYPALPVGEASPSARITGVVESVAAAAACGQPSTTAALMGALRFVPASVAAIANRTMQFHTGLFNLTVTNVPGPPVPAHFLGGDLTLILGATPLTRRHALTIAVLSYNGSLTFMVTTDPRRLPDGVELTDDIEAELDELRACITDAPRSRGETR